MGRTFSRCVVGLAFLSLLLSWPAAPVTGQSGAKNGEWRTYGGDLGNTHYSPLDQINASNFNKLEVAWRFKTDNLGPQPEYNLESTPLMANGVALLDGRNTARSRGAGCSHRRIDMDAWRARRQRGVEAPRQLSGRGLAYWSDGREERILYVTPGYRLIALDAEDGAPVFVIRQRRRCRFEVGGRPGDRSRQRRDRAACDACGRRRHGDRRCSPPSGRIRQQEKREGLRSRFRCSHRQASLDFPYHPLPNEFGAETWESDSAVYRQCRRVGPDQRR